jgi:hypothetical protein
MPEEPDRVERVLDTALEETFPASDPIAVTVFPRTGPCADCLIDAINTLDAVTRKSLAT